MLAAKAGVSDMTISQIERSSTNYRRSRLAAVARALEVNPVYLAMPVPDTAPDAMTAASAHGMGGAAPGTSRSRPRGAASRAGLSAEVQQLRAEVERLGQQTHDDRVRRRDDRAELQRLAREARAARAAVARAPGSETGAREATADAASRIGPPPTAATTQHDAASMFLRVEGMTSEDGGRSANVSDDITAPATAYCGWVSALNYRNMTLLTAMGQHGPVLQRTGLSGTGFGSDSDGWRCSSVFARVTLRVSRVPPTMSSQEYFPRRQAALRLAIGIHRAQSQPRDASEAGEAHLQPRALPEPGEGASPSRQCQGRAAKGEQNEAGTVDRRALRTRHPQR